MSPSAVSSPGRVAVQPVTQHAIRRVLIAGYGLVMLCLLAAGLLGVRNIASIRAASAALRLISGDRTNKAIAALLNLGVCTVDAHRGRILEKLNLHSTGELVRFALRKGLID